MRRTAGRPSLSGMATSPQIAFQVSQLAREALEERVAHPRS